MGVKNNYYKAMFLNNETLKAKKEENLQKRDCKFQLFFITSEILSIEGFVFLTLLIKYLDVELLAIILSVCYISANLLISTIKFYQLSYNGFYKKKS